MAKIGRICYFLAHGPEVLPRHRLRYERHGSHRVDHGLDII